MQQYVKRIIEQVINWAVPVICAGVVVMWGRIPADLQHYWPVGLVFIQGVYSIVLSYQNHNEIKHLRSIHEREEAKEAERKAVNDSNAKAFRAMLDMLMAELYGICVQKGHTTEEDRRMYNRLHNAYIGIGGNGEAKRRKTHFDALPDEEEYKARLGQA